MTAHRLAYAMRPLSISLSLAALTVLRTWCGLSALAQTEQRFAVLVLSKTTGYRHDSIPAGIAALKTLGADHGFSVDSTEDATRFTDAELARYKVVDHLLGGIESAAGAAAGCADGRQN